MERCLLKEIFEDHTRTLNEYCQSSRLERKHVIKVLRGQRQRVASLKSYCATRIIGLT
jgi:hypothetical protein